jgi:hypothetical protein
MDCHTIQNSIIRLTRSSGNKYQPTFLTLFNIIVCKDMVPHKITEFYMHWFSACTNITSRFRTIIIFKSFIKQNNESNKTYMYIHDLCCTKLHSSKYSDSRVVSIKQHNFNFNRPPCLYFWFFRKIV